MDNVAAHPVLRELAQFMYDETLKEQMGVSWHRLPKAQQVGFERLASAVYLHLAKMDFGELVEFLETDDTVKCPFCEGEFDVFT